MKKITAKYQNYTIKYYLCPGKDPKLTKKLFSDLQTINTESRNNLSYGIFNPDISDEELRLFFENIILAILYNEQNELAGFFYNVIIDYEDPFVHQGLVMISKNSGLDLIRIPYLYSNIIMGNFFKKEFHTSNISTVPQIIGIFAEIFDDVWPHYYCNNLQLPPKDYKIYCQKLFDNYIKPFFPKGSSLNLKRFVLTSPLAKIGFATNMRELPRYKDINQMLFANFWIDTEKGEDLIQIGKYTDNCKHNYLKILNQYDFNIIEEKEN